MKRIATYLLAIVAICSCTEVMDDFELGTAESKVVVDAVLSPTKATVVLSKTTSYLNPTKIPYIGGADVTLSFNNQTVTLNEDSAGFYSYKGMFPVGTSYNLSIMCENQTITATSYMPEPVFWDSVIVRKSNLFDQLGGLGDMMKDSAKALYEILGYMTDPEEENFYRVEMYKNDTLVMKDVSDDGYLNGQNVQMLTNMAEYEAGDKVVVCLKSIDSEAYKFYSSLMLSNSSTGIFSAPDNPLSNLVGDALGRFYAYSVDSLVVTFGKNEHQD